MELYKNHLAHSYWGSRVSDIPNLEEYHPFWFGADFSATDIAGKRVNSTDKLRREYPTYGTADMRSPALQVENAAGESVTRLHYESHRIYEGKPGLAGLPATYGDDCETLYALSKEIALYKAYQQDIHQDFLTVYEKNVIFYCALPLKRAIRESPLLHESFISNYPLRRRRRG